MRTEALYSGCDCADAIQVRKWAVQGGNGGKMKQRNGEGLSVRDQGCQKESDLAGEKQGQEIN